MRSEEEIRKHIDVLRKHVESAERRGDGKRAWDYRQRILALEWVLGGEWERTNGEVEEKVAVVELEYADKHLHPKEGGGLIVWIGRSKREAKEIRDGCNQRVEKQGWARSFHVFALRDGNWVDIDEELDE